MPHLGIDRRRLITVALAALVAGGEARAEACPISIGVNYNGWKGLEGWTGQLTPMIATWWPKIVRALGADGCPPITSLRLAFYAIKPEGIAAAADGDRILINAPYVLANQGNPDMFRMIGHELVHVAQAYPPPAKPTWLTEGIADYVRYWVLLPDDPGRYFDPGAETWREGYAPAADLLGWLESREPGSIAAVNTAMRAGQDGEAALVRFSGSPMDVLWSDYLRTKPAAASAEKRRAYRGSLKPP